MNSKGQLVGNENTGDFWAYYDSAGLSLYGVEDEEAWASRLYDFGGNNTQMLRINDAGQALVYRFIKILTHREPRICPSDERPVPH